MLNLSYKKQIPLVHIAIGLLIVGVISFVIINTKDSIFGTPLSVDITENGSTVLSSFLPISGSARHARDVLVNGRSVVVDREGNFTDAVMLSPGYNVVHVALKDQFGKEKVRMYEFVYTPEETVAQGAYNNYQQ